MSNKTERIGINYIRKIIKRTGHRFFEVPHKNDKGIDVFLEVFDSSTSKARTISIQVKSGNSYFDRKREKCKIPVGDHYDYWRNYPFPVIGVVYVPYLLKAYWVDIKRYFIYQGEKSYIQFSACEDYEFSRKSLQDVIKSRAHNKDIQGLGIKNFLITEHQFQSILEVFSIIFKEIYPVIVSSKSWLDFVKNMQWEVISLNELDTYKKSNYFYTSYSSLGKCMISEANKLICFDSQAELSLEEKFQSLKSIIEMTPTLI